MVVEVYGYVPAWDKVPDISPYVTKVLYYLEMNKIPYEHKNQNLATLDTDAPYGKLPYIIDTENGQKVADSNTIVAYLEKKYKPMDADMSAPERAIAIAFERLIGEHLYYSGILQPRWRMDEGFEVYVPYIVMGADVSPELRAVLDTFRGRILDGFKGQGMGRRDDAAVLDFYKQDIDALSDFLGDKKFLMGDKPRSVDASAMAILRHLSSQPMKWEGTGYLQTKKNLMAYMDHMNATFPGLKK